MKLDETGRFVFCFFGSKMKLAVVSWVELTKIVKASIFGGEKLEADGCGAAQPRAVSFKFFSRPKLAVSYFYASFIT